MNIVKALGSLPAAIALLGLLAVLLTVSTLLESAYGTPFAQKHFYTALWFDGVLALVGVNLFCAALSRWPFKKHHTGFLVTHAGIITLLAGALVSRTFGVEGQLPLFEGETRGSILLPGYALKARSEQGWRSADLKKRGTTLELPGGLRVTVLRTLEKAARMRRVAEGPEGAPANPGVEARVSSGTVGLDDTFTLVAHDPRDPHAAFRSIGPATFELETRAAPATEGGATLKLFETRSGRTHALPLAPGAGATHALEGGLRLENLRYLPHAKVIDGKLVDAPEAIRFNPAVEFDAVGPGGERETHTKFFLFPQFGSLRGGKDADRLGLEVLLDAEVPAELRKEKEGAGFTFVHESPGKWRWESRSTRSGNKAGELRVGEAVEPGWMDVRVEPQRLFERARVEESVAPAEDAAGGGFAVEVELRGADGDAERFWLFAEEPRPLSTAEGPAQVVLAPETRAVPFHLTLLDFRKVDYPGTTNPASFESDVKLTDPERGVTIERTIKMNKPLDYAGYRIFQSSYFQDAQGEGSVFTVAKNPGIGLIYGGAAVILAGVLLLFYLHPFFNPNLKRN